MRIQDGGHSPWSAPTRYFPGTTGKRLGLSNGTTIHPITLASGHPIRQRNGALSGPGVCDREIGEAVEVAGVAGDHGHVVVKGGGRDECVSEGGGIRYVQRR